MVIIMRLLSSEEMKLVEQHAARFGLSYQRMMENAGTACARNIRNEIEKENLQKKRIAVVCGKGNNGGDGFVVARKLFESGYNVCVVLALGYPTSQEATYMYKLVLDQSIPTVWYDVDKLKTLQTIKNADVIVDAIFGFSFYGEFDNEMKDLVREMSQSSAKKFALDVPSGVYCDSGHCDPDSFKADYTIAISALKPAHIIHPASEHCGDIIIANIGIPDESYSVVGDCLYTYNKTEVKRLFPKREATAHKNDFGHVLCICGSRTMPGAPVLAASAALRSGAGLVTLAFPESIYPVVSAKLTEALLMPLAENEEGTFSVLALKKLLSQLDKYDSIVIGCGMGVNEDTRAVLNAVIENAKVPIVIDADALNILSKDLTVLHKAKSKLVLTPHIGEMHRLTNVDKNIIASEKTSISRKFSDHYGVYLVLKGSNTVVSNPVDKRVYINNTGNTGLSKGGSGDVLAGLIGGFIAQKFEFIDALTCAVFVHGYTGDAVSDRTSKTGMLPSDVVSELAYSMGNFEN